MDEEGWQELIDELIEKVRETAEDDEDLVRGLSCLKDEATKQRLYAIENLEPESDPEFGDD